MSCDYEIQYKQGRINLATDVLSRVFAADVIAEAIKAVSPNILEKVRDTWEIDLIVKNIISQLQKGDQIKNYTWQDNQLRKKGKLVVGNNENVRVKLVSTIYQLVVIL